jgi:alpha-glucosidase
VVRRPDAAEVRPSSSELRRRLVAGEESVVARWLRPPFELDGWRIDVANMTGRQGASTSTVRSRATSARRWPRSAGDRWLVAEHCHDATADLVGDGWHGTMAYTWFTRPVWCWLRGDATDVGTARFPGAASAARRLPRSWLRCVSSPAAFRGPRSRRR